MGDAKDKPVACWCVCGVHQWEEVTTDHVRPAIVNVCEHTHE